MIETRTRLMAGKWDRRIAIAASILLALFAGGFGSVAAHTLPPGPSPSGPSPSGPAPTAPGPTGDSSLPALLLGSDFGDARLVALDTQGRIVGRGAGEAGVTDVSMCPGEMRLAEAVWEWDLNTGSRPPVIAVRSLPGLDVVGEHDPATAGPMEQGPGDILCRDETGTDVVVFVPGSGIAALGPQPRLIAAGDWRLGVLSRDHAVVVPAKGANEVHLIDLADGSDRLLYAMPGGVPDKEDPDGNQFSGGSWDIHSMAVSPFGDRVAIVDWGDQQPGHTLRVFSLADGTLRYQVELPGHGGTTTGWWVGDDTLAIVFLGDNGPNQEAIWGTVMLLDSASGTEVSRWQGLEIYPHLIADGVLFGTPVSGLAGVVAAVPINGGAASLVGTFETALIQQVHGRVPAQVRVVATLAAFDGAALLAARAGSALPEPSSGILGTLGFVIAGAVGIALLLAIVVIARRRGDATSS